MDYASGFYPESRGFESFRQLMPYSDKDQQRKYQRERNARIRAEWLKEHGPCTDCGSEERLEVDHSDRALKVSHKVWSWSKERREKELEKCVVRCFSCHRTKTRLEIHGEREHGTLPMYERGGCRCDLCRGANRRRVVLQRKFGTYRGLA